MAARGWLAAIGGLAVTLALPTEGGAQTATQSASGSSLPPVVVDEPSRARPAARAQRTRNAPASVARSQRGRSSTSAPPAAAAATSAAETATGPVAGYVAGRSASGSKTDTALIETPASVSVVTRDQISDQGAQSVSQALRYTAGTFVDLRPSSRYDIVPVRGFGNNNGPLQGFVGFQDGLKLQRGISFAVPTVDSYGLERVEVLRGPASILYGQSSLGGLVNLVSKKPTEKAFGEIELSGGTWDRKQAAFDLGGPADTEGKWLYRMTGLARDSGTQVSGTEDQRYMIAPALTYRPSLDTTLTVLANYTYDPNSWYSVFLPARGTVTANPFGQIPTSFNVGDPNYEVFSRKQASVGYQFEHRFNNALAVRQNLRYMNLATDFQGVSFSGFGANLHTLNRSKSKVLEQVDTLALDNQVEAKLSTGPFSHTVLFGLDYQYADASRKLGSSAAVPSIDFLNPVYGTISATPAFQTDATQVNNQFGVYLQDQIKFDRLVLMLSGRHDRAGFDYRQTTLSTNARTLASQSDDAWTYRVGALYHFDSGFAPYVSYSTSFEPVTGTVLSFDRTAFKPTTGEQIEGGLKYEMPGQRLLATIAGYELTQRNVQTADPNPTHVGCSGVATARCSIQTGAVQTRGVEVEVKASLDFGLDLIGSYTYQDMKITETNTATELGKRPVQVPEHLAALWGLYHFKHVSSGPLGGLSLGAGVRYVGESFGDSINTLVVPSYTVTDAALHYDLEYLSPSLKGTRFSINASNLFDKVYVASCGVGTSFDAGCYYGLRRTVLATLRYRW
ncbi:TonB-dependent siderophore receptor [Rhodopseudomonas sp. NSM]|uniref:TonB-dependent siderophore receptor n=1 Tax=Rhodopseudomonas sp. NSM TaxID=3457630 RepID=UPI004035345D